MSDRISPRDREREIPEGVQRQPVRVHKSARSYLKSRTEGSERTISQELNSYLPDNWEDFQFGYESDDLAYMKLTPQTKQRIKAMTGPHISQGDVVALFVMLGALRNGDLDDAHTIGLHTPELIWDLLNDMSESICTGADRE